MQTIGKFLRAWLSSKQGLTFSQALDFALETAAQLAHLDPASATTALVIQIVEGLIMSATHHAEAGGPITTPTQAVTMAVKLIMSVTHHAEAGGPITTPTQAVTMAVKLAGQAEAAGNGGR